MYFAVARLVGYYVAQGENVHLELFHLLRLLDSPNLEQCTT